MKKKKAKGYTYSMRQAWLKESKELREDGYMSKSDLELMRIWFYAGFQSALKSQKRKESIPERVEEK